MTRRRLDWTVCCVRCCGRQHGSYRLPRPTSVNQRIRQHVATPVTCLKRTSLVTSCNSYRTTPPTNESATEMNGRTNNAFTPAANEPQTLAAEFSYQRYCKIASDEQSDKLPANNAVKPQIDECSSHAEGISSSQSPAIAGQTSELPISTITEDPRSSLYSRALVQKDTHNNNDGDDYLSEDHDSRIAQVQLSRLKNLTSTKNHHQDSQPTSKTQTNNATTMEDSSVHNAEGFGNELRSRASVQSVMTQLLGKKSTQSIATTSNKSRATYKIGIQTTTTLDKHRSKSIFDFRSSLTSQRTVQTIRKNSAQSSDDSKAKWRMIRHHFDLDAPLSEHWAFLESMARDFRTMAQPASDDSGFILNQPQGPAPEIKRKTKIDIDEKLNIMLREKDETQVGQTLTTGAHTLQQCGQTSGTNSECKLSANDKNNDQ